MSGEAVLGTAAVAIRSTDAGFEGDLKAKVNAAAAKVKATVPVAADTASAETGFARLASVAKGKLDSIAGPNNVVSKGLKQIGDVGLDTSSVLSGALTGGIVAVAGALATLAIKGIGEFQKATAEVRTLKGAMGSTAEEASGLRNAAAALGVSSSDLVKGLNKLSINLNKTGGDFADVHVQTQKNADGTTNLYGTFLNLRDAYQGIHDPQQKTIFLQEAMAKGGVSLKAVLSATDEELQKFAKRGPIFSDQDLKDSRDLAIAQRGLSTSVKTLEIDLGKGLVPTLTLFSNTVSGVLGPIDHMAAAVGGVGGIVSHVASAALGPAGILLGAFGSSHKKAGDEADVARGKFELQTEALKSEGVEVSAAEVKIGELTEENKKAAAEAEKHAAAVNTLAAQVTTAYLATGGAAESLGEDQHNLAKSFDASKDAAAQLKSGLDILTGTHVSAQQAAINYEAQVDALTKSFTDNGTTLDISTEKGRENYKNILDLITSTGNLSVSLTNEGKSNDEVTRTYAAHIEELRSTLRAAGLTEEQIQGLIDKYHLLAAAPDLTKNVYLNSYHKDYYDTVRGQDPWVGSMAQGGQLGSPGGLPRAATGMKTSGPTLVGEGSPRWPEYVIATDPAYRPRNMDFLGQAAKDMGMKGSDSNGWGGNGGGATLHATIVGSDPAEVVARAMAALNWASGS